MAESKIKDENYYQISGWMINRLKLKGTPLNVFAIIYGFSQDGESEFSGSRQYLADFINSSKPTIDKALTELCDLEYIFKTQKVINNVTFNTYKANLSLVKELCWGSKETLPPSKESLQGGSKETLPNNKSFNNKNNNKNNIKESKKATFDDIINSFTDDEEIKELLGEWLKVRKAKRAAMTNRAIELNLKKLHSLAEKSNMSVVDYLKEVICRGWQAFYEIKDYSNPSKQKDENYTFNGKRLSELTQKEYEEFHKKQGKKAFCSRTYSEDFLNSLIDNLDDIKIY